MLAMPKNKYQDFASGHDGLQELITFLLQKLETGQNI